MNEQPSKHNDAPNARKPRRWGRRCIMLVLLLGLVLTVAFITLTRGPLARSIVLTQLRSLSDAQVDIRRATINPNGTIAIEGLSIAASDLKGPQAQILQATSAVVSVSGLRSGSPSITSIDIVEPVLRASRDMESGAWSIASIQFKKQSPRGASDLPIVKVTGGVLELGEHTQSDYSLLRRIPIEATLAPTTEPQTHILTLVQHMPEQSPFQIIATIRPDRTDVTLDELDIADWPNEAIPSHLRALHQSLALQGRVLPTDLTIFKDGGIDLRATLESVQLDLPVEQTPLARGHMADVNGTIHINANGVFADVAGFIDGVPATATFTAESLSIDSPFSCDIHVGRVRLAENLERLGYVPEFVREQLEIFSSPTAEVALDLTVARSEPADEPAAEGLIHLFDGVASYREFPYAFTNLTGILEIADNTLFLRDITGESASGARLQATGEIGPLGPIAQAKIDISVTDVPLDSRLRTALGVQHQDLYDALLNRERYRTLREQNLILTPREARDRASELESLRSSANTLSDEQRDRLAELTSLVEVPPFALGGRSSVDIDIFRHLGEENIWDIDVTVHVPRAGFVPEQFPLPIVAEDVTIRIQENTASISSSEGRFYTLAGGSAQVEALAGLTNEDALPKITITATDIPITPLLINAIPGDPDAAPGTMNARELLGSLGLRGTIDCIAQIGQPNRPPYVVDVTPQSITATIDGWTPSQGGVVDALQLANIQGAIYADPSSLRLDLGADLVSGHDNHPAAASLQANIAYGDAAQNVMQIQSLSASLPSLVLTHPVEQLIAWVDQPAAQQLHDLRERFRPTGTIAVNLNHQTINESLPETVLTIDQARDLTIRARDLDMTIVESTGSIRISKGQRSAVYIEQFGGRVLIDREPFAQAELQGTLPLSNLTSTEIVDSGDAAAASVLSATLTGVNYDSRVIGRFLPADADSIGRFLADADPAGTLDLTAAVSVTPGRQFDLTSLYINPHRIEFTYNEQRVNLGFTEGSIAFQDGQAKIQQLAFDASNWSGRLDGRFEVGDLASADQQKQADLAFSLDATSLTPELQALLPSSISSVLDQLSVTVNGPLQLEGGHLLYAQSVAGSRLDILGRLMVQDGSMNAGIELDRVTATVDFVAHTDPTLGTPEFEMVVDAPTFRAGQVWMSNGTVTLRSTPDGKAIEVNPIIAESHGGRIAATAVVWSTPDDRIQYDFESTLSGVRFAPILQDLALDTQLRDPEQAVDDSRGSIDARMSMYGVIDGPRRGVGLIQVSQGRVLKLPLLVPLIEVSNLALPMGEQLELARARFYLLNDEATFEELSVLSRSIELIGYGTLNIPDQTLDLRVNSRANKRIPLLSPVLESIRDELVTIRVQGTLREPAISTDPLTNTRAAISTLFGREPSSQEKLLRDIKRRALEFRERSRLSSKQVKTAIENFEQQGNNQDQ